MNEEAAASKEADSGSMCREVVDLCVVKVKFWVLFQMNIIQLKRAAQSIGCLHSIWLTVCLSVLWASNYQICVNTPYGCVRYCICIVWIGAPVPLLCITPMCTIYRYNIQYILYILTAIYFCWFILDCFAGCERRRPDEGKQRSSQGHVWSSEWEHLSASHTVPG